MIILRESNRHARRQIYIPHMGSELQTSHKDDLTQSRKAAEGEKTQTENIRQSSGMNQLNQLFGFCVYSLRLLRLCVRHD
jgi:hypothetical protein